MKKIILLVLAILSFSNFTDAQSSDKALEQLETVRVQKGELSQDYLSALDSVILKALMAGEKTTAFAYRKQHLDIVKQMKGERCVEVGDDLWRLGNTSCMLGDTVAGLDYYTQAADVFEKSIDLKKNYDYFQHYNACLFFILQILASNKDQEGVAYYSTKFKKLSEKTEGIHSCSHLENLRAISWSNTIAGNKDNALNYYTELVNNCSIIDSCNYMSVNIAYSFLKTSYYYSDQHDLKVKTALEHLDKLDAAIVPLTSEIIDALYYLIFNSNTIEEQIAFGKRAEKTLLEFHNQKEDLLQDERYFQVLDALSLKYDILGDYISAQTYCQLAREVLIQTNRKNSKEYYDILNRLFDCSYNTENISLMKSIAPELEGMIFEFSEKPIEDAFLYVGYLGDANAKIGNYKEALYYYNESLGLLPQCFNGEALDNARATIFASMAELSIMAGMKQEASMSLREATKTINRLSTSEDAKHLKAYICSLEGQLIPNYEEAIAKFDTALYLNGQLISENMSKLSVLENGGIDITDSLGMVSAESILALNNIQSLYDDKGVYLLNKGLVQFKNGATMEAYQSFKEAEQVFKDIKNENSLSSIVCQNNIALCQLGMGLYSNAIITLDNNMRIVKENYGTDNFYYAICRQNFANYYHIIGDDVLALRYNEEAAKIFKNVYGERSEQYGQILGSMGLLYLALNKPNEAYKYLTESASIVNEAGSFPTFSCFLNRGLAIATLQLGTDEETWEKGWNYYNQAMSLTDSIYGTKSIEHAQLALSLGVSMLDFEKGKYIAYERFLEAAGTMLSIDQTSNPDFIRSLILLGLSWLEYDTPITEDYTELLTNSVKDYYEKNFAFFTSGDRETVWGMLSNIKNTIISTRVDERNNIHLFNYSLFYKSLLLSSLDNFRNAVLQSGRQHLIDQYNDVQALQRTINKQSIEMSDKNQTLENLYEQKNSMERKLIAEMKVLGYSLNERAVYYDVTRTLKENEIAVEFENYYHLKKKQWYYVAMIGKTTWDNPIFVELCTEDELKACLGNPNVTYSTDDLYRLLWQPLLEYVGDSSTVYFSPSGMLHTIALESIHTPDGSCLSDKYNLVRLTSTRELCKAKQPKTYETGAIYGGLQYDVEQQRMAEVAAMNKTELEESPVFALRGDDRGNWNYLPGTLAEAEHIADIMRQANIGCGLYEGDLGSEESFKALSGGNTDIIHLATHGYFIEGEKADMNDFMNSLSPFARQKTDSIIDPLLRSGLILSGGNNAWLGKEVPEGIEDGVLTALEISTMNLSGTDMVVMSACETGLGDITSDGVFGLQRAFKMAGVQTLVMSLWKVDDNATSLMMQTFYEQLFSGKTKREAFGLAQAAVRNKYTEPYYWAGFVMLD